jgi:hypothetical protein
VIGVLATPDDMAVVREFFELFKTPWEVCQPGRRYDVLLCAADVELPYGVAEMVVVYSGRKVSCDSTTDPVSHVASLPRQAKGRIIRYRRTSIPVYGDSVIFPDMEPGMLIDEESGKAAAHIQRSAGVTMARIGYDLFAEIRFLLTTGQPVCSAGTATLEWHIAVLRDLIVANGLSLVEIPPIPGGYRFIASLTHDVDHPSIRLHRFDHTVVGFLYRAIIGSVVNVLRRRATLRDLFANWAAAAKLPFVYLGFAKDFWKEFEQYPALEAGMPSTFFVIPFRDNAGRHRNGPAPRKRASAYGAAEIADSIAALNAAGCEIGLHGIDGWCDTAKAREEMQEVCRIARSGKLGVRMHWLYFDSRSPEVLDAAGADYDSTAGYNEVIGYRAGTAQAYKPLQAEHLLELPLIIMDTALFFPKHQHLTVEQARGQVQAIVDNAVAFGGCITINWHDRSISPERNWTAFYTHLVDELRMRGAWFATASDVVAWFRKRRSVVFSSEGTDTGISFDAPECAHTPELQLRVHSGADRAQDSPIRAGGRLISIYVTTGESSLA